MNPISQTGAIGYLHERWPYIEDSAPGDQRIVERHNSNMTIFDAVMTGVKELLSIHCVVF
ncbi:MAG: hypothetical protein Ct9H300mP11_05880 [Chloroflexota bacterium]|nr:MAG: hypothetical protein Ct9H300mP11_05880 [Chloroflexota bacterium]